MSRAYYVNSLSVRARERESEHLTSQCYYVRMCCRLLYRLCISVSRNEKRMIDKRRKYVCNIILLIVSTDNEEKLMVRIMS